MEDRRLYRRLHRGADLVYFQVKVEQTDLCIGACRDLSNEAKALVLSCREVLTGWIRGHEEFLTSLVPLDMPADAPELVAAMYRSAQAAGVGPMAAVAGAVAQAVGEGLLTYSPNIIVENGGDIYIAGNRDRIIGIYAGESPLSHKVGVMIQAGQLPMGVCTSSGTVGHSLSFGKADAVMVLAHDAALADAAATATANRVQTVQDIQSALGFISGIPGIVGAVAIKDDQLGAWGEIELCRL
jgi:ApbE superfamily uncharacterized protein (UPF0280 family)